MMEIDDSQDDISKKCDFLRNISVNGGLRTSVGRLSGSSRIIPSQKDFYFYHNFPEFKNPVEGIDRKSKYLLEKIGGSERLFGKAIPFPDDKDVELDDDVGLDWLVNVNDEILERFDASLDEFKCSRKEEEKTGVRTMRVNGEEENGFQMVLGKKNKKSLSGLERSSKGALSEVPEVKMAAKIKAKVPFHIPTIRKPQDEYKIIVNNSNQPFEHVWLQKSDDGSRFLHPLERHSFLEFVDKSSSSIDPVKPLPIEVTSFKLVEEVKDLKQLAIKLRSLDEFAVDLEHNQYRSFQGLTCLMQISTRTEDFVIDTLKLRVHIGPHLREIFKDPTKRKVMHGADRDIMWLQRDFGIYVCNMFDTGQASRVLKMERNSLEYLLNHFCGVVANKEYQNADWRIRPLPKEMIKYGREDTHYLLYIYDLMRMRLIMSSADSESLDPPLVEVYKRSYDICTQLYEKELLTDTSYLFIYGLQDADLSAEQLAVVSALCQWRDVVARAEDESTGYVLPNRTLIEIAKQMPLTTSYLRRVLKSKHPYIDRNLGSIVSIIRNSIPNAPEYEEVSKCLKERRLELASEGNTLATEGSDVLPSEDPEILANAVEVDNIEDTTIYSPSVILRPPTSVQEKGKFENIGSPSSKGATSLLPPEKRAKENCETGDRNANTQSSTSVHHPEDTCTNLNPSHGVEATVQLLKKPSRGFGVLFGNSGKRKINSDKREQGENKLEKIQSSVALSFHSFSGSDARLLSDVEEPAKTLEVVHQVNVPAAKTSSTLEDVIVLDDDISDDEQLAKVNSIVASTEQSNLPEKNKADSDSDPDPEGEDEPMSLTDLSSNFKKCLTSPEQTLGSKMADPSQSSKGFLQVKPFDYETARNQINLVENRKEPAEGSQGNNSRKKDRKQNIVVSQSHKDDGTVDLLQGKRRQAFPASGNRSASFR